MKRMLLSSLWLLLACWASAQNIITVSGTVTRSSDGSPVDSWFVSAFAFDPQDSTQFGFAEGFTDANGHYAFELEAPSNATEVILETETACYDGSPDILDVFSPIVNAGASADFEICANDPPVWDCEAGFDSQNIDSLTVQFNSYFSSIDSTVAVIWFWDFGDGNTSTEENPVHTYNADGVYDVTLTITSANGCVSSITDHICVGGFQTPPDCIAWFESDNIDSLSVQFTSYFVTQDSAGAVSWFWDFGDGQTSMEENPIHTYATDGIYEVTLSVFSASGCGAFYDDHVCVGIVFPPGPDCSVQPYIDPLDSLTFAFSGDYFSLDSLGAASWFWDFGDGNTSTDPSPVHTYDQPGLYFVTVIVTSPNGCVAEVSFPLFTDAPFSPDCAAYIDYNYLDSLSVSFNAEVFGVNGDSLGVLSYFWQFDDGTTSNDPNPQHTFPEDGIYSVELTVLTADSCLTYASAVVIVGDSPVDTFFYGCQAMFFVSGVSPDSLTLSFEDVSFGSPVEWHWEFGDGSTSTDQNPTHTYDQAGVYQVELSIVTSTGCESNVSFDVCVKEDCPWQGEQDCQALFIPLPDSLGGLGFEFVDLSYAQSPIQAWHWDFGDGETSNEQNPFHQYAAPGVYNVTLSIEADSCQSEITFQLDTQEPWNFCRNSIAKLGVATGSLLATKDHQHIFKAMRLFPNPAQSTVNLVFEARDVAPYTLRVTDLAGRTLISNQKDAMNGSNMSQVDVSTLVPGFYLLELRTANDVQVVKFVKQ